MSVAIADLYTEHDPTPCEACGLEACEDPAHLPPAARDRAAEDAAAVAARHAIAVGQELARERARREARRRLDAEARGPIVAPAMGTLRELLAEPDPEIRWRIDGWQPAESRVVLAAPRKAGKTTLVGSLVRSLIDGDPWLDLYPVRPVRGAVAVIDTEMSRPQLRGWLRDQCIARDDRVIVIPMRGQTAQLDLLDPETCTRWAAWLRARDVRYLVIDCLRPILDALGLDESREAGRWLVRLDALLLEAAIPDAMVVHHMGHTGERSRGDSRLRDWPDVEWRLMREDEDSSPRYLAAYGRDVDQPESQLAYDPTSRRLTLVGGSRQQARAASALDALIEVLEGAGAPRSGRQIEAALEDSDHGRAAVRAALSQGLRERRLLVEDGPRRSRLYRSPSMIPAHPMEAAS